MSLSDTSSLGLANSNTAEHQSLVRNINVEHHAGLSALERMAVAISDHVGTPGFFLLIAGWTVIWVLWNSFAPAHLCFDRAMEFTVWIFISNVIQICLLPLLMVAQNLQTRHDELRAENEYLLNVRSEQEIEVILGHLHMLDEKINTIMEHLDIPTEQTSHPDRVPDVAEEEFAQRQQELLDQMALKLAQTHENVLQRVGLTQPPTPATRRLPK
ncbi:MAG TPA: DUF1003 domain-containing protein [Armatimonadota bacterium]|nr:DUF1003 domain-containing protein [Armatimonadota bacterium]